MKKVLFFLLLSVLIHGQYMVSPYYGEQEVYADRYIPRQMTFYDIASVQMNNQFILYDVLNLTEVNSKNNFTSGLASGSYTFTYSTGVGKNISRLNVKYNVVLYGNIHLVKSIEITGSPFLVIKFYIYAWPTKSEEGDLKKNELLKKYNLQDDISYQYHNGKPIITVNNRQLKNVDDFIKFREESQAAYTKNHKPQDPVKKLTAQEQEENEKRLNDSIKADRKTKLEQLQSKKSSVFSAETYIVDSKKNTISPAPNEKVLQFIQQSLSGKKKGIYSFWIKDKSADEIKGNFHLIR